MISNIILKIKKRIVFELTKKYKKLNYMLFRGDIFDQGEGNYVENNVIASSIDGLLDFYNRKVDVKDRELIDADRVLSGEYNLVYFNSNIEVKDWNTDYESGYVYEKKYHGDIKYIVDDSKTDVKNVWEFSRLHHVVILAKAYAITLEEKYYKAYKEVMLSWLSANPNGKSVNWTCNMEVSIRVVNIIISFDLLKNRVRNDDDFMMILKSTIYYHNKHIYNNLENYSEKRNNHYLSNLMGLLISSKFLQNKNLDKYKKYQEFAKNELEREIDKQILNDGVTYEISTSYQKLVFEILILSFILGQSEENPFEDKYYRILLKMSNFLKSIMNEDGHIPLIGDNDSGNVLVFDDYFNSKRSNLLTIMNLSDYYFNVKFDKKLALTTYFDTKSNNHLEIENKKNYFRESGFYILENMSFKMILLCGPLSMKGQGGHSHNDQLSFVLDVGGKAVFIDPGTITYTGNAKLRNLSRKTAYHNTVQVENEEQNIIGNDLFAMEERTFSKCTEFSNVKFSGYHKGFIPKYNVIHARSVKLEDSKVIISDSLDNLSEGSSKMGKVNLILDGNIRILNESGSLILENDSFKLRTNIDFNGCKIDEILASDRYGHYFKTNRLIFNFIDNNELELELI